MMPLGPATRIYLAAGATDLRNYSERLIIPSSVKRKAVVGQIQRLLLFPTRNNPGVLFPADEASAEQRKDTYD